MSWRTGGWDDLVVPNLIERDWQEAANCLVDDPKDTRFIRRPTPAEEEEWGFICAHCPVFQDCFSWSERNEASGVFVAGEWRE
jgi:hypothetical protein